MPTQTATTRKATIQTMVRHINVAADGCRHSPDFRLDVQRCGELVSEGGPGSVKAECWLRLLCALERDGIQEYLNNTYQPGALNPYPEQ